MNKRDRDKDLSEKIRKKEKRKIESREKDSKHDVFFGLGMFGVVGWSVAIPALLFTALGIYIDSHANGKHSWTLMLLIFGVIIGSATAWFWIEKERKE